MVPQDSSASYRILNKLAYLLSARWIRDGLQTVFFIYLARVSSNTFGEFMLALGLGSILIQVSEFGLNLPLVSFLHRKGGDPAETLGQVSLLKTSLFVLSWLGALVLVFWQDYPLALKQLVLVLCAGVALEALASTFFVALQVQGRQKLEGQIRVAGAGLGFGYGLVTLALGAPPLIIALFKLIETLANLVGGVVAVTRAWPHLWPWRWPALRRLWDTARQGLVFALLEVTAVTYNKANLFFLQRYGGSQAVAQYSVTWQMVDGFSCLAANLLLQSVLFPLFVQFWEKDRAKVPRLGQDTARWLMAVAFGLMFVLAVESDRLITLIYGPHYQEAVWMQKYLVITILFAFLHNLAAFLMMAMRLERLLLLFYLAGLLINLVWCALAIPAMPLLGAALAMVLTKGGVAALSVSYAQRRLGIIPLKAVGQLVAVSLLGAALYWGSTPVLPREAAEALGLLPLLVLMGKWRHTERTAAHEPPAHN